MGPTRAQEPRKKHFFSLLLLRLGHKSVRAFLGAVLFCCLDDDCCDDHDYYDYDYYYYRYYCYRYCY